MEKPLGFEFGLRSGQFFGFMGLKSETYEAKSRNSLTAGVRIVNNVLALQLLSNVNWIDRDTSHRVPPSSSPVRNPANSITILASGGCDRDQQQ